MEERRIAATMEQVHDYEFRVAFAPGMAELVMDEGPPLGADRGPSPARVLAAAVGNCLCASLLFCLRKSRVEPDGMRATVESAIARNEKGRLRIASIHVSITAGIAPADRERSGRCLGIFEDFCTVTQSVRGGIPVSVEVRDAEGQLLHASPGT
jgi:uncharacterized OsmC-like protein